MSESGPVVRGYRPSCISGYEPDESEGEVIRLANLERYILRAQAGLPIFEEPGQAESGRAAAMFRRQ